MIIVKIGGAKNIDFDNIAQDLKNIDDQIILVHGASKTRDEIADNLGHPAKTVVSPSGVSSVFTDEKALEIFLMAYCGLVNKQIVAGLQRNGINAVGLSGIDGRLWEGKRKDLTLVKEGDKVKVMRGNHTGKIEKINKNLIEVLLDANYVPVVSAPGISYEGEIINTDNDTATTLMALALGARKIVSLFEAPGLLKDVNDPKSLIKEIAKEKIQDYFEFAKDRMMKKIMSAEKALNKGVKAVYFGDVRVQNPVTNALTGKGTIIK